VALSRRVDIFAHWMAGRRNGVSIAELASFLVGPTCGMRSRRYIESITEEPDGLVVHLRGVSRPLFWPRGLPLYPLHMVLAECLDPTNWHYYEVPETRVSSDDVVADAGAAEGLFALLVESRARHTYIIEPSATWTEPLRRTFAGSDRVTVLPVALGAETGTAYLSAGTLDSAVSSAPQERAQKIVVETIDNLFAHRGQAMTYLKADLEGYEMSMLAGAEETIGRYLPKLAITTYHRPEHADEITAFLRRIEPRYQVRVKGIDYHTGSPMMLHAWVPQQPGLR
jgi:FkbM family methyltransferase